MAYRVNGLISRGKAFAAQMIAVVALVSTTSRAAVPVVLEYNLSRKMGPGGFSSAIYLSPSGKFSDNWNFSNETLISVPHANRTGEIIYSRFNFKNTGVAKLGDWNLDINYRYMAPLTAKQYTAGSWGTVFARPDLSTKFGDLSVLIRNALSWNLAPKFAKAETEGAARKANSSFGYTFEFIPSYEINVEWSLSALFVLNFTRVGADEGSSNSGFSKRLILDPIEVSYAPAALGGWSLAATVENDTTVKRDNTTGKLLDKREWSYILKVSKVF